MNKTLEFNTPEIEISQLAFSGKRLKLIYSIDVPSTASIWWKEYNKWDNVKLFPENELSLQQEINYIKRICESNSDEPLLIITKSPFILQEFPQALVSFAKLDDQSMCRFSECPNSTYGNSISDIVRMVTDGKFHPNINRVLYYIPMDEYYNVITVNETNLDTLKEIQKWSKDKQIT